MKTKTIILISAVSCFGLAGTFAYFLNNTDAPVKVVSTEPPATAAAPRVAAAPRTVERNFTNIVRMDWNQVESDDYRKYITNLRAIGCPEPTIRDIIVADVNKLFENREKELIGPKPKFEYWKRQQSRAITEEKMKQRIQLVKEKRAILRELLGVNVEDKTPVMPSSSEASERLSFLSKEKQEQVIDLEATYRARIQALMGNKVRPSKADMEKYEALMVEAESEVAKLLTPQEFEDFQLTTSRTAQMMRATMGDFEMTEQEFRDVFKLRQDFEGKYGMTMGPGAEEPEKVLARAEVEKKIRNLMGEQRYTDYNREQSWSTSTLQNVAQEFGVPKETAAKVFDLKPVAQEQAARIQLDNSLSPEQKQRALQAVQQETVQEIGKLIGKEAAEAYYRQGAWIKNLAQLPEPTVAKTQVH